MLAVAELDACSGVIRRQKVGHFLVLVNTQEGSICPQYKTLLN